MRALLNRILSAIGTGGLAMHGLAGCGSVEATVPASDASGDNVAADGPAAGADYGVDDAAWNAHGRLTCVQARRANERAIVEVVEPCLAALAGVARARRPTLSSIPHQASSRIGL
jgi:hypothetical protein